MRSRWLRAVACAVIALFTLLHADPAHAARRRSRRRAPATPTPTATGATLEQRLASLLASPVARSSEASVEVVEIDSGRAVAELTPHQPLAPASNMKLFTTAGAIDLLQPPQFEIKTAMYVRGNVEPNGTLDGDVKIAGHGDPTIGGRFHDGNATEVQQEWANDLQRAGIKTVHGNLIFEYGYMDTEYIHPTWPADQFVTWYEAPVSAFSEQEGCVQVRVLPSRPGRQCTVQLEPPTNFVEVDNTCVTGRGLPFITRFRNSNTIIVRGGVPARSGPTEVFISVEDPIHYFATVTAETFLRAGLKVEGQIVVTPHDERSDWRVLSQHSTPLNILVYVINKKSQNHYAEQLVKIVGAEKRHEGTWESGTAAVTEWLTGKLGVPPEEFHQVDGSGLSRDNRASANAFIHLLTYMWKSPYRDDFVSSLPYSGDPDAKFGKRLRRPPYARQVYAKTGYIVGVIGLSGYVHAQSGRIYAFSFIFNHYRVGVYAIYNLQDALLKEIIGGG